MRRLVGRTCARARARITGAPRGQDGAAALEFALVFPVLLLLVLGIIQYGFRYWGMSTGAATAREAARLMVVNTDWSCARDWALRQAGHSATGPVTVTLTNTTTHAVISTATLIPEGTPITVTVSFDSLDLGLGMVPGSRVSESADAVVQYEPTVFNGGTTSPQPCPAEYS